MSETTKPKRSGMSPVIMMMLIVIITMVLTFVLPSGEYQRENKLVVPNSYQVIEKPISAMNFVSASLAEKEKGQAAPVGIADALQSVPEGIAKQSGLIFMVLFIGGMFGILNKTGAIEAGLERTLVLTRGNIYLLVPVIMVIFSAGSTFMGLAKEYLLVIPMVIALTSRLGYSNVLGLAIVTIAVKVGYLASITNPYALSVAQPLLGLPVFSGLSLRVLTYFVMMALGIAFVLWKAKQERLQNNFQTTTVTFESKPLSNQHTAMLTVLIIGVAFMVYGSNEWKWKTSALSAYYMFLSMVFAAIAGMRPSEAADAFVSGMKKVMIAAILIGLATAVEIVLSKGKVLDTVIHYLVDFIGSGGAYVSAYSMFFSQLLLDIAIPSTSGQAAVTMPIMGPVGQLSGVSPQTTVLAFLMGNGLTNVITPTSSGLLIFLATAQVSWTQWAKFIWPLIIMLAIVAMALLTLAVYIGY
ncbi:YfcC family protein [Glaesserella parasuis]|uniref:YfcC family protein n=1 Tax=Glaesserella parasuis TaxID=738 RepID=UPI0018C8DF6D|nr:YfcC family protein [Glaesserella parasuis]MDG4922999.1 YfcC family protein [Glaesserella parasuis]MDG6227967.1 YfcC family protein [Glaesserella parasuis]MDG6233854.1 YfcC family protein [Glaesserella parasuis]MDG6253464.1 YfcC family protein [Glaesserella parasuis]MDG6261982.1 YfcC family protein [Glaesserella parasuis]